MRVVIRVIAPVAIAQQAVLAERIVIWLRPALSDRCCRDRQRQPADLRFEDALRPEEWHTDSFERQALLEYAPRQQLVRSLERLHEAERGQAHAKIGVVHGQGILSCESIRTRKG